MIKKSGQNDYRKKSLESVRLADQVSGLIVKEQQTVMDTQQKYAEHSMDLDRSVSEIEGIAEKTILLSDRKEKIVTGIRTLTEISKKNAGQNANVNQKYIRYYFRNTKMQTEDVKK